METALEQILMTAYKEQMIAFMNSHPECFDEALELATGNKQPYSWRAAWLLWSCTVENDERLPKYIDRIINSIEGKKDGHQRELLKTLIQMELTEEQEGYLFNLCVNLWERINSSPSIRYTAFRFIAKMAKKYPDLANEITLYTQDHYIETISPGIKNSLLKMIKDL